MLIVVDVESDGPAPGIHSMISFGAVVVEPALNRTFKAFTKPITDLWVPEALAISKISRETHLTYPDPAVVIPEFAAWVLEQTGGKRARMASDCITYDFAFMNYYMYRFNGSNPFGFSGKSIPCLYAGMVKDDAKRSQWSLFSKTPHDHDPLNDAMGMAEALIAMRRLGLKLPLIPGASG